MQYKLSCEQVSALINFYAEDSLSETLKKYVKEHLEYCPVCNEKYLNIKTVMNNYVSVPETCDDEKYNTKQYEQFKINLSAYIDNELAANDNIKMKKIAISNPLARQDLEDIYSFKKLMHSSFEKTKNELKYDYSKNIICTIKNNCKKGIESFYNIVTLFLAIISIIICGIIVFLYT